MTNRYCEEQKLRIIQAIHNARFSGLTWSESVRAARVAGFKGTAQSIQKFYQYNEKLAAKVLPPPKQSSQYQLAWLYGAYGNNIEEFRRLVDSRTVARGKNRYNRPGDEVVAKYLSEQAGFSINWRAVAAFRFRHHIVSYRKGDARLGPTSVPRSHPLFPSVPSIAPVSPVQVPPVQPRPTRNDSSLFDPNLQAFIQKRVEVRQLEASLTRAKAELEELKGKL